MHKFLISLSSPLELTIISHVKTEDTNNLGLALQAHVTLLRTCGFEVVRVEVDPQRALSNLSGSFPGVEVDVSGAGDHLPKIDIKIRRVKEMGRCIIAGLLWNLQ